MKGMQGTTGFGAAVPFTCCLQIPFSVAGTHIQTKVATDIQDTRLENGLWYTQFQTKERENQPLVTGDPVECQK